MSTDNQSDGLIQNNLAKQALTSSSVLWFLVTAIGQWVFVFYVAAYYLPILTSDGLPGLAQTHLPNGYVAGDLAGNLAIATHIVIAIIIIGSGPLQLIPQIRNKFPRFHRYVGRTYMLTAVITSIAGIYLVWSRGVLGGIVGQLGITLDGVLIIICAAFALKYALARNFVAHRQWALRLFLVVSAVWFFRIGLMFWVFTTGGAGIDFETFTGPFIYFWFFGQTLLPLAILELYLQAKKSKNKAIKYFTSALLVIVSIMTGLGVFAALMGMWLPKLM